MEHNEIIDILQHTGCSCVIALGDSIRLCHRRGVVDILEILRHEPDVLNEAFIADKVVGKGAAALMVLGQVREVYAEVISEPALNMLREAGIPVGYAQLVPSIINKSGSGPCPVEALCASCATAVQCLPLIENFVDRIISNNN